MLKNGKSTIVAISVGLVPVRKVLLNYQRVLGVTGGVRGDSFGIDREVGTKTCK